jgi:ribosomal protein L10
MLLVQLDNLDTPSRLALKVNLGQMGLSLKTPKAHILKKVIRQSRIRELEPSIVGFMGVATSSKEPCELQNCLQFLNSHSKVIIIGGKIGLHAFSTEGINDIISQVPSMRRLHEALVGLLQSPAQALSSMLQRAPQSLTATLTQHIEVMAGNSKEGKE